MSSTKKSNVAPLKKYSDSIFSIIKKSISKTVIVLWLITSLITCTLGGILIYTYIDNLSKLSAAQVDSYMQKKCSILESVATSISSGTVGNQPYISIYLNSIVTYDEDVLKVYLYKNDNSAYQSGNWAQPDSFSVTSEVWFSAAQAEPDKIYFSEPFMDTDSSRLCIKLAKAVFDHGNVCGTAAVDVYIDTISDWLADDITGLSYSVVSTSLDTVISHPDSDYLCLYNPVGHKFNINKNLTVPFKSAVSGFYVTTVVPVLPLALAVAAVILLLILMFAIISALNKSYARRRTANKFDSLLNITDKISELAKGNLSVRFDEEPESEEIEELEIALNYTVTILKVYINSFADAVSDIINRVSSISLDESLNGDFVVIEKKLLELQENYMDIFNKIANQADLLTLYPDKIHGITSALVNTSNEQTSSISLVSDNISTLESQAKQVSEATNAIIANFDITNSNLANGQQELSNFLAAVSSIEDAYSNIQSLIRDMNKGADQTNLLALSASVEAARIGRIGKPFADIATEISTLSASTIESGNSIEFAIANFKDSIEKSRDLVDASFKALKASVDDSSRAKLEINNIASKVSTQINTIEQINSNVVDLALKIKSTNEIADDYLAISQEIKTDVDKISQFSRS